MKTKNILFITVISILVGSLINCSSIKESLNEKQPFEISSATYNNWHSSQPSVRGIDVTVVIDNPKVTLDSIYFRNMKTVFEKSVQSKEEKYISHFTYPNKKNEVILHGNPEKEFGNEVPDISKQIPYDLKSNEAVITYIYKGTKHYSKILNLIDTTSN